MMDLPWYRKNEEKKNIHQATHTPGPALVCTHNHVCIPTDVLGTLCLHTCVHSHKACVQHWQVLGTL